MSVKKGFFKGLTWILQNCAGDREKKAGRIRILSVLMAGMLVFSGMGNTISVQAAEEGSIPAQAEQDESAPAQAEQNAEGGSSEEIPAEVFGTVSGGDMAVDGDPAGDAAELNHILGRPMTEEEEQEQMELFQYYMSLGGELLPEVETGENTLPADMTADRGALPASYDSRNVNGRSIVPEIRNQNPYGNCWSYSAIACLEINLIKKGLAGLDVDLSELHLSFYASHSAPDPLGNDGDAISYFDISQTNGVNYLNRGGNQGMASGALMNWKGAVEEELVTIDMALAGLDTKSSGLAYENNAYCLSGWYQIPTADQAAVKDAIMKYGALSLSYYSDGMYYNASTASVYCPDYVEGRGTNHAVTVIGWDDSYSRYNFNVAPSRDGAWLVRNSWGPRWGDGGYFWLSYEDQSIANTLYATEGERSSVYDHNYQYDHGTSTGYITVVKAANVYTAKANGNKMEELKAAGIYFNNSAISYSLQVYTNLTDPTNPESGTPALAYPVTGTSGYAGYYKIPFNEGVMLEPGDTFAIVFELSREPSQRPYVGCEYNSDSWRYSETTAEAGESLCVYQSGYSWSDFGTRNNKNLKIKAYTNDINTEVVPCQGIAISGSSHTVDVGKSIKCNVSFNPVNTTNKELNWSSSDPSVAEVSGEGIVTGLKAGKAKITATTRKTGHSAEWEITVEQPVTSVNIRYNSEDGHYYAGETYQAVVEIGPADATDKSLTWESSDSKVAEVDAQGNIALKTEGSVTITAVAQSGVSCSVTIQVMDDKVRSFVKRMYTKALGRTEDAGGLKDWTNRLKNQEIDGAGLAHGFICSDEFTARRLDNGAYIDTLYSTFFDRAADRGGKADWMQQLASGRSREYVLSGFVNSLEFSNLCDRYQIARGTMQEDGSFIYRPGVREFVLRLYTKALNRGGETMGVEDWANRINTRTATAEEVAKSFFNSEEFANRKLSDEDYVEVLYQTFMDRASDAAGKADWVRKLRGGMTRERVLEGFSQSAEFGNIMKQYGL